MGIFGILPVFGLVLTGCQFDFNTDSTTPIVSAVTVSPAVVSVAKGGTRQFIATVSGSNDPAQTVTWSVTGGSGTGITSGGLLTVASGETAGTLIVTATSVVDTAKSGTAIVTVTGTSGGGNTHPKTLVITGIPASQVDSESYIQIGIFPVGTTWEQAFFGTDIIAGAAKASNEGISVDSGPDSS
ncbi:MAG: Ig-like domain-containing protein [Treponema sp.]|jgi:hypothetical protein|nr:Ig-like domain-containing protein [Treponema sp.]